MSQGKKVKLLPIILPPPKSQNKNIKQAEKQGAARYDKNIKFITVSTVYLFKDGQARVLSNVFVLPMPSGDGREATMSS